MRIAWLFVLLLLPFAVAADDDLWQKLQHEPHMIVLLRNAESTGNRDGANMLTWDSSGKCIGESTLTDEGKDQAMRIGAAFVRHGIQPFVISSPMCRCTETAKIAFGRYLTDPELRQRPVEDTQGLETFQATVSKLFAKHRGVSPVVFVNHRPNIDALTMEMIEIGELLLGTLSEEGEIEVLGRLRLDP
ncbi:MAG: histidine phosphatase family protein [Candidatus Thiodiazotropha sp.]